MEIIIAIKIKYCDSEFDYVLRYLGRQGEEIKWCMFSHLPHLPYNRKFQKLEDLKDKFPNIIFIDKLFKPGHCPTLKEIPLDSLYGN